METGGLILTKTQAKIALILIVLIWIITFFLGHRVGRYANTNYKEKEITQADKSETESSSHSDKETLPVKEKFYTITLGWENDLKRAEGIKKRFEEKGLSGVMILEMPANEKIKYRITLGKFIDKTDALKAKKTYTETRKLSDDVWVYYYER
ncbi:MAG: hypothetical protein AB1765_04320 [Candidatus Hydrogenedentota bacterium]